MGLSERIAHLRHLRVLRRMAGPRLLLAFADAYPRARFVEIGANDGDQHDHLSPLIVERGWRGVMVEPVPYVFERLRRNFGAVDGVRLEMAAIAARTGTSTLFHLAEAPDPAAHDLPTWYDGIGSFSREALLAHAPQIPDIEDLVVETRVPCLTFDSLCAKHGLSAVDILAVDTEGHDWEILKTVDLAHWRPRLVVYEHYHLNGRDRGQAAAHLRSHGYELLAEGFDTFCLLAEADDDLARAFRRLRPAVPAASKDSEVP